MACQNKMAAGARGTPSMVMPSASFASSSARTIHLPISRFVSTFYHLSSYRFALDSRKQKRHFRWQNARRANRTRVKRHFGGVVLGLRQKDENQSSRDERGRSHELRARQNTQHSRETWMEARHQNHVQRGGRPGPQYHSSRHK